MAKQNKCKEDIFGFGKIAEAITTMIVLILCTPMGWIGLFILIMVIEALKQK